MSELEQSLDLQALVDHARKLWRDASTRASTGRVELYAKVALRRRATRDLNRSDATYDHVIESGLAARVFGAGHHHAGFAAASGLSSAVARWVVDTACTHRAQAIALAPTHADPVDAERWDADPSGTQPSADALTEALRAQPDVHWLEAGTTAEIVIGADGWLAARTRHRFWALVGGIAARLVAQRGFPGWERLLATTVRAQPSDPRAVPADFDAVILTPEAAAPLVTSVIDAFNKAEQLSWKTCGAGWDVADDPLRPDGLAGGTFDDAGFPAARRTLAAHGLWVDRLRGPGTLRRVSFREPPAESPSNLVVASGEVEAIPTHVPTAHRCRVVPLSPDQWVLELEFSKAGNNDGSRTNHRWIRVGPATLISACAARLGTARVTAVGPIVPALLFEGLETGENLGSSRSE